MSSCTLNTLTQRPITHDSALSTHHWILSSFPIEHRPGWPAVKGQRAMLAHRVRSCEYPILPCRKTSENLCFESLRTCKTQAGLQCRKSVGRQAGSFLDGQPEGLFIIELVYRKSYDPYFFR